MKKWQRVIVAAMLTAGFSTVALAQKNLAVEGNGKMKGRELNKKYLDAQALVKREKNKKITIVLFGDSTTAPRGSLKIYAKILKNEGYNITIRSFVRSVLSDLKKMRLSCKLKISKLKTKQEETHYGY